MDFTPAPTAALHVAALGGGHGLPVVLRALKPFTENITAIVSMADDGGSSGRLRREMGVLPPGDLRNNIAALADDEALMTQLFQYRFGDDTLEGHSLGNLLITALATITGSMDRALAAAGKVLAIHGQVLPATLQDVTLAADLRQSDGTSQRVVGESNIPLAEGVIERIYLQPPNVRAFPPAIQAILGADLIVFGPGSLYTSILPSILIGDIAEAIRAASAPCVYVCNIAMQQGETTDFSVADHVAVLEDHLGRDFIDVVLCNDTYPPLDGSSRTQYVPFSDDDRARLTHYTLIAADLTDSAHPWRHDPYKLAQALLKLAEPVSRL
jgi:uncharacterized cofD-like protein